MATRFSLRNFIATAHEVWEMVFMSQRYEDSSEELYSLNTTTADIFDFSSPTFISPEANFATKRHFSVGRYFASIFGVLRSFIFGVFKVSFELLTFILAYFTYFKAKIWQLARFFDVSKDQIVSSLMWRRGLLFRPATHGGVVVVAAIAALAGGLFTQGQIAAQDLTPADSALKIANTTQTIVPTDRPRSDVITYSVEGGDTLSTVAEKFGISVDSIKWANGMTQSDNLHPSDTLKIPPVSGVVYKVKAGDTIETVAKAYTADAQTIADFPFNYVDDTLSLKVDQTLYVPGGSIPQPKPVRPAASSVARSVNLGGSGVLSWPVPRRISQYFSWFHQGIDLANPMGTPIYAGAGGTVIDAKRQTYSFGWYCIINIGNGYTVAYAHMSDLACSVGQTIAKGQYIGAVGMTGRATGPHLHLEVRRNGTAVDPLSLLP